MTPHLSPAIRSRWSVVTLFCVVGLTLPAVFPAESVWRAGFARATITPPEPIMLGGYANRQEPFRRVIQDLYVKALALEDDQGLRAVLLTADLIGFRAPTANAIIDRISAGSGLDRSRILLNSSHTHTGPSATASAGVALGATESTRLERYHQRLQDSVVETALAALHGLSPARLSHGSGIASFVMNRREPTAQGIKLGFNPRGPTDRTVPVLRVTDPRGVLRGVVFGAACHATTIPPGENEVTGDYPGYAQEYLESHFPGVQAMFMQGFGGDSGPYPTGKLEYARQHGATLGGEVRRLLDGRSLTPVRGPLNVAQVFTDLPLAAPLSRKEIEVLTASPQLWQKLAASRMLVQMEQGVAPLTSYRAPITLWQFGQDLTLVALPGEVVGDYIANMERVLGPLRLWLSGYNNDVFGYLPSARVLREGGYETRGVYTGERFTPGVEEHVSGVVRDLARTVGRALP